ncbi:MAG TPA: trehalose-6-phosphate synthase [Acidimicrobiales bacterium]|nr:trehalose-6-phosphate synthase [Acidimicrobiales bacterium]
MGGHFDLIIASNRGPLSFTTDQEGRLVTTRAAGGLVSSLAPAVRGTGALWVAAAISDADRAAAEHGLVEAEGLRVRSLAIEPDSYRQFYDVVSNATLWFVHHDLFDLARRPHLDGRWRQAWESFRQVNRQFAEVVAEEASEGATVLVHDYHLALVGSTLAGLRPDLRTVHFNHTPFCEPTGLRVLPDDVADELLAGMAGYHACGFHSARWARAFERCYQGRPATPPRTFVAPAVVDLEELEDVARSPECAGELARLDDEVGDRRLVGRVERIEPSKNLLRGFLAFEELLRQQPEWRGRVVFAAHVYPSRSTLPDYLAYRMETEALVERINNRWATDDWVPVLLDTSDSFARSVAILRRCQVLLVNPIRDGFNLVAKEGSAVNECDAVLVLSREAGAWDELGGDAIGINPFDVAATGDALHRALTMDPAERAARSARSRATARRKTPSDWLAQLLAPLTAPAGTGC